MFTREAVMYDDSNLNKNEFTGLISFAVNVHFSLHIAGALTLLLSRPVSLLWLSSGGEGREIWNWGWMEKERGGKRERKGETGREIEIKPVTFQSHFIFYCSR